jgi:hypothetical protein
MDSANADFLTAVDSEGWATPKPSDSQGDPVLEGEEQQQQPSERQLQDPTPTYCGSPSAIRPATQLSSRRKPRGTDLLQLAQIEAIDDCFSNTLVLSNGRTVKVTHSQLGDYDFFDKEKEFRRKRKQELEQSSQGYSSSLILSADEFPTLIDPRYSDTRYGVGTYGLGQVDCSLNDRATRQRVLLSWKDAKKVQAQQRKADAAAQNDGRFRLTTVQKSAMARAAIMRAREGVLDTIRLRRKEEDQKMKKLNDEIEATNRVRAQYIQKIRTQQKEEEEKKKKMKDQHLVELALLNQEEHKLQRAMVDERKQDILAQRQEAATLQMIRKVTAAERLAAEKEAAAQARHQLAVEHRKKLDELLHQSYESLEDLVRTFHEINRTAKNTTLQGIFSARQRDLDRRAKIRKEIREATKRNESLCEARRGESKQEKRAQRDAIYKSPTSGSDSSASTPCRHFVERMQAAPRMPHLSPIRRTREVERSLLV